MEQEYITTEKFDNFIDIYNKDKQNVAAACFDIIEAVSILNNRILKLEQYVKKNTLGELSNGR